MTAPPPATATPKAHPALVAAAVLLVVVVCGPIAVQLMSEVVSRTVERTNSFAPATARFVVDTDVGDVTLTPSPDGRVHVSTVVRHNIAEPRLIEETTSAGLRLDVDCNEALTDSCDVAYAVQVPPGFEVVIGGTGGDVAATGLTGSLTVDRLTGDVTVLDHTGPLDVRTRAGGITGDDVRSDVVRAASDTGDVQLELQALPRTWRSTPPRAGSISGFRPIRVTASRS